MTTQHDFEHLLDVPQSPTASPRCVASSSYRQPTILFLVGMLQHLEKGDPTIFVYFPAVHDTAVGAAHTVTAAALRLGVVINAYRVEATTAHFHTLDTRLATLLDSLRL